MKRLLTAIMALSCGATTHVLGQTRCDIMVAINNRDPGQTTDATGTNLRSGPGTSWKVLTTLKNERGFRFHVTGVDGSWFRVDHYFAGESPEYKNLNGWVYAPSTFIKVGEESGDDAEAPIYSLFAEASTRSRKVRPAKEGDVVPMVGCKEKWAKVKYGDDIGWLSEGTQCDILDGTCG